MANQNSEPLIPDAPVGTSVHAKSRWAILLRRPLLWYRTSVVPTLLRECRNSARRIRVEREVQHAASQGSPIVPPVLAQIAVQGNPAYRHAYIQSMRQLENDLAPLTTWDLIVATRMWTAGANWKSCSERTSPDQRSCRQDNDRGAQKESGL